jgi:hypothetical protein
VAHRAGWRRGLRRERPDQPGPGRRDRSINASAAAGFTNGADTGGFDPGGDVRRDQMASFLTRDLDLLVEEGTTRPKQ